MSRDLAGLRLALAAGATVSLLVACGGQSTPAASPSAITPTSAGATPAPSGTPAASSPSGTSPTPGPTRGRPSPTVTASGQIETALETALEKSVESAITTSLAEAGVTLASGPDCTADLKADPSGKSASGTVTCTGKTTTGLAVKATFSGSASANGTCSGQLVVKVGGTTVVNESLASCTITF